VENGAAGSLTTKLQHLLNSLIGTAGTSARSCSTKMMAASMSEPIVKLPKTCDRCHCLSGKIVAEQVVCCGCGAPRMPVSAKTRNMIERVSTMFGAPAEIVFRTSDARDQIEKQDLLLSNKYVGNGRSFYQVITDTMTGGDDEAPIDVGAVEDVTEL
jgi:hypothetical protein